MSAFPRALPALPVLPGSTKKSRRNFKVVSSRACPISVLCHAPERRFFA
jgi:hypothetical protein